MIWRFAFVYFHRMSCILIKILSFTSDSVPGCHSLLTTVSFQVETNPSVLTTVPLFPTNQHTHTHPARPSVSY